MSSTMDVAAELVEREPCPGLVIVAGEQRAGRGRRGRVWSSPPDAGLYLSFVLAPNLDPATSASLPLLTLAAGAALQDALRGATGVVAELKWPNDLMVRGRKLAGILAEGIAIGTPEQRVILGVGVNLRRASHPEEVAARATSLEELLDAQVGRRAVLEETLVAMPRICARLKHGDSGGILRDWRAAAPSADGAPVEWTAANGSQRGTTAGVDEGGALLIRTARGIQRVHAGVIHWL